MSACYDGLWRVFPHLYLLLLDGLKKRDNGVLNGLTDTHNHFAIQVGPKTQLKGSETRVASYINNLIIKYTRKPCYKLWNKCARSAAYIVQAFLSR